MCCENASLLPFIFTHKLLFIQNIRRAGDFYLSKEDMHFEKLKEKQTYLINLNFLALQGKIFMIWPLLTSPLNFFFFFEETFIFDCARPQLWCMAFPSCGVQAQLPCGMQDVTRIKPVSLALDGEFFTIGPPWTFLIFPN